MKYPGADGRIALIAVEQILGPGTDPSTVRAPAPGTAPAPAAAPPQQEAPKPADATPRRPVVGMTVEARKHGEWHRAKIERQRPNQFFVTFEGRGSGWDDWLNTNDLRPIGSTKSFLMIELEGD